MPKKKIAIISVLKPVDDVRSFEKMATTLAEEKLYDIHLIGYPSHQTPIKPDNIHFHAHHPFKPVSFSRWSVRLKVLFKLIKLKPQLVIANTHELLNVMFIYKILFGAKICYDIQENYYYNLKYQANHNRLFSWLASKIIRLTEVIISPFINHFFLAEKCYQEELNFIGSRSSVLENKALKPKGLIGKRKPDQMEHFLFSGTITKSNGIYIALRIFDVITDQNPSAKLKIIGHCPDNQLYHHLCGLEKPNVELIVSQTPIPHAQIIEAITQADMGIVSYQINPSNQNCMPTKVYEYCAYHLPIIFEKGAHWGSFINEYGSGIAIDFESLSQLDLQEISTPNNQNKNELYWSFEKQKLIEAIEELA